MKHDNKCLYQKKENFWWESYKYAATLKSSFWKNRNESEFWESLDEICSESVRTLPSESKKSAWAGTSGNHLEQPLESRTLDQVTQCPVEQNLQFVVLSRGSGVHPGTVRWRWTMLLGENTWLVTWLCADVQCWTVLSMAKELLVHVERNNYISNACRSGKGRTFVVFNGLSSILVVIVNWYKCIRMDSR